MSKNKNQNAIKHGAFAEVVILPEEDPKEWEELVTSLNDEWDPEGPIEKDIINSIAMGMWRKRRFRQYLQKLLAGATMPDIAMRRKKRRHYERLVKIQEELEVVGCVTEENLSDKLDQHAADAIKRACPRKNYDSDSAWQSAVASLIEGCLERFILEDDSYDPMNNRGLADEGLADREQSFEERIDAKIGRDLKQLGQIKTMKAIGIGRQRMPVATEPLKQIEAPAIQAVESEQCEEGL